jgi:hypothetical protein
VASLVRRHCTFRGALTKLRAANVTSTLMTRSEPNLILLLYSDRSDAVARALVAGAARLHCDLLAMSLSQLVDEARAGALWKWRGRSIDPSRTAVVNRLVSVETGDAAAPPLESSFQSREFWTWIAGELQRFAYVSSAPSAVSPLGSFGSLADQWSELPQLITGLRVPAHRPGVSAQALHGDVCVVNPWHLYSLGKRANADGEPVPSGHLAYVRPAGKLFHVAQVGSAVIVPNAPPHMRQEQWAHVESFTRSMSALSSSRILEHAFFDGDEVPIFYSSCPVPVVTGGHPAYTELLVRGLHDDIESRSERAAA